MGNKGFIIDKNNKKYSILYKKTSILSKLIYDF